MQEKTDKLITWVSLGIAVLAGVFAIVFAMNENGAMFDIAFWITFLFLILGVLGMLGFFCLQFIKNFKENPAKARKTLIVMGIAVVVVVLAYLMASGNDVPLDMLKKNDVSEGASRWIGAACIGVYMLVIAAVVAIIYTECAKLFKK